MFRGHFVALLLLSLSAFSISGAAEAAPRGISEGTSLLTYDPQTLRFHFLYFDGTRSISVLDRNTNNFFPYSDAYRLKEYFPLTISSSSIPSGINARNIDIIPYLLLSGGDFFAPRKPNTHLYRNQLRISGAVQESSQLDMAVILPNGKIFHDAPNGNFPDVTPISRFIDVNIHGEILGMRKMGKTRSALLTEYGVAYAEFSQSSSQQNWETKVFHYLDLTQRPVLSSQSQQSFAMREPLFVHAGGGNDIWVIAENTQGIPGALHIEVTPNGLVLNEVYLLNLVNRVALGSPIFMGTDTARTQTGSGGMLSQVVGVGDAGELYIKHGEGELVIDPVHLNGTQQVMSYTPDVYADINLMNNQIIPAGHRLVAVGLRRSHFQLWLPPLTKAPSLMMNSGRASSGGGVNGSPAAAGKQGTGTSDESKDKKEYPLAGIIGQQVVELFNHEAKKVKPRFEWSDIRSLANQGGIPIATVGLILSISGGELRALYKELAIEERDKLNLEEGEVGEYPRGYRPKKGKQAEKISLEKLVGIFRTAPGIQITLQHCSQFFKKS